MANEIAGGALPAPCFQLPMLTQVVCMMLLVWLGPDTISLAPIHCIIIIPSPIIALYPQLQFLDTTASVPVGGITASNNQIKFFKSKATQVFCTFQTSTPYADIVVLVALLVNKQGQTCSAWHVWLLCALSNKSRPYFSEFFWFHCAFSVPVG